MTLSENLKFLSKNREVVNTGISKGLETFSEMVKNEISRDSLDSLTDMANKYESNNGQTEFLEEFKDIIKNGFVEFESKLKAKKNPFYDENSVYTNYLQKSPEEKDLLSVSNEEKKELYEILSSLKKLGKFNSDRYRKVKEEEALKFLINTDSNYLFGAEKMNGGMHDNYLLYENGQETNCLPSQLINAGIDLVEKNAILRYWAEELAKSPIDVSVLKKIQNLTIRGKYAT